MVPVVFDCTSRDRAGALSGALAVLASRVDLAVGVLTGGRGPCRVRAVVRSTEHLADTTA